MIRFFFLTEPSFLKPFQTSVIQSLWVPTRFKKKCCQVIESGFPLTSFAIIYLKKYVQKMTAVNGQQMKRERERNTASTQTPECDCIVWSTLDAYSFRSCIPSISFHRDCIWTHYYNGNYFIVTLFFLSFSLFLFFLPITTNLKNFSFSMEWATLTTCITVPNKLWRFVTRVHEN